MGSPYEVITEDGVKIWGIREMKKVLLISAILLLTFVGLRRNSAPFISVKEYRCIQTGLLSDDYFSSISTAVGELLGSNCSAHVVIDNLKKQFPAVSKVVVSYRPVAVHVMVYAHKPVCSINNSLVLTTGDELFAKNVFSERVLVAIPDIAVAQESMTKIPLLLSSLLHALPSNFNETYDLELINEHCVRLIDKQERHFTIVSSIAQKTMPQLLAQCELVKKNIGERKDFGKGITWIADTRFADYIVAYKA